MRYILIFLAPLLLNAAMLLGVYKDQNLSGWVMSEKIRWRARHLGRQKPKIAQ